MTPKKTTPPQEPVPDRPRPRTSPTLADRLGGDMGLTGTVSARHIAQLGQARLDEEMQKWREAKKASGQSPDTPDAAPVPTDTPTEETS